MIPTPTLHLIYPPILSKPFLDKVKQLVETILSTQTGRPHQTSKITTPPILSMTTPPHFIHAWWPGPHAPAAEPGAQGIRGATAVGACGPGHPPAPRLAQA